MSLPILRQRQRGPSVQTLQQALVRAAGSDTVDCLGASYPMGKVLADDGIFGTITRQALLAFQTRERDRTADQAEPFDVDAICGSDTWAALGVTTNSVATRHRAAATPARAGSQGRRAGRARDLFGTRIDPPAGTDMPNWMVIAWGEHAKYVQESVGGDRNNPDILRYLSVAPGLPGQLFLSDSGAGPGNRANARRQDDRREANGHSRFIEASLEGRMSNEVDETPWCACFVQWCMLEAGYPRRSNLSAASAWLPTDAETSLPRYGAITVVEHAPRKFHVGFFLQAIAGGVKLLGGNQLNRVSVRDYHGNLSFNWPVAPGH